MTPKPAMMPVTVKEQAAGLMMIAARLSMAS
jgi:hypothetical protein